MGFYDDPCLHSGGNLNLKEKGPDRPHGPSVEGRGPRDGAGSQGGRVRSVVSDFTLGVTATSPRKPLPTSAPALETTRKRLDPWPSQAPLFPLSATVSVPPETATVPIIPRLYSLLFSGVS